MDVMLWESLYYTLNIEIYIFFLFHAYETKEENETGMTSASAQLICWAIEHQ